MKNVALRSITGLFIIIFVLGGFWSHPFSFVITGMIIMSAAMYEYYTLVRRTGVRPQIIPGMILGVTAYAISAGIAAGLISKPFYLLLIPLVSVVMVIELFRSAEQPFNSLAHTFFAILYITIPFSMFPFSAFGREGLPALVTGFGYTFSPGILIGFFLLLWANDTGAYIVGSAIGKHKLYAKISPAKSWEGFFGGMIFAIAAAWFLAGWLGVIDRLGWVTVAFIVSVAGTLGDLVESMLKRSMNAKDSGGFLPGHGGFLDRFDSVIIAFPLVYFYIVIFG